MTACLNNFYARCELIILQRNVSQKCADTLQLFTDWNNGHYPELDRDELAKKILSPGRPEKPELVHPLKVPKRKIGSQVGLASLLHSITHIEFNAINLALDACYRFDNMPKEYYSNWLEVASEEVYHFKLLCNHLEKLGFSYGSFPAHNGLWDMAVQTDMDVLFRMAMVPRVLEARGLDAIPELEKKLSAISDPELHQTLNIIHRDEIKHVSYGNYWFQHICNLRNLNPEQTFLALLEQFAAPKIRGAFNRKGRLLAGFSETELDAIAPTNINPASEKH
jgi:uncharacterized ferritin-like protein (DUF455 family)